MRAVLITEFGAEPSVEQVPDPAPRPDGVVVRVQATGVCASDRHAWLGHDDGVVLPHVPGHELVGDVVAIGAEVTRARVGDRVTTPFVCGCGRCDECRSGRAQVCPNQEQPGFTHWGSFAEYVEVRHADANLVPVDPDADAGGAALLGCRFATAYRALADRAAVRPGERVLVLGAGGVGLSAVLVGSALGAEIVVADPSPGARAFAAELGAVATVDPSGPDGTERVRDVLGDARVALEAAGRPESLALGIRVLRRQGVLVQVGLLAAEPVVPVPDMIARELTLTGSHGMAAADYPRLTALIDNGRLAPERLVTARIPLDDAPAALAGPTGPGVTVVEP